MELNLIPWETHSHSMGEHRLRAVSTVWTSLFITKRSSIPGAVFVCLSPCHSWHVALLISFLQTLKNPSSRYSERISTACLCTCKLQHIQTFTICSWIERDKCGWVFFVNINETIIFLMKDTEAAFLCWLYCDSPHSAAARHSLYIHREPWVMRTLDVRFCSGFLTVWDERGLETHCIWFLTESTDALCHFIPGVTLAESVELSWPRYDLYICCTDYCSNFRTRISQWPWHAFCSLLVLAVLMNTFFLSKGSRCGPLDYPHRWWLLNSF